MKLGKGSLIKPMVDGPQPAEAARQLEEESFVCPGCHSVGFEMSVLGPHSCTFCDGTESGNPPTVKEIARARADVLARRTPGGISNRAAAVRGVLALVDAALDRTLEELCAIEPGLSQFLRDPRHRQNFGKAATRFAKESRKFKKYPRAAQREVLLRAEAAFAQARDEMRRLGDRLTQEADDAQQP